MNGLNQLTLAVIGSSFNDLCWISSLTSPSANSNLGRADSIETWVGNEPDSTTPCEVVPLGMVLYAPNPPAHLTTPSGYRYLGKLEDLPTDHLYREQDGHVALWLPELPGLSRGFLIDKYAITAHQFSRFLNALIDLGFAHTEGREQKGVTCCLTSDGRLLTLDAWDQWRKTTAPHKPAMPGHVLPRRTVATCCGL